MGTKIPSPAIAKIQKLIPRLASDADGEIIATVRAIGRALKSHKRDWHDLAAALTALDASPNQQARNPRPGPRPHGVAPGYEESYAMARWLYDNLDHALRPPSRGFVRTMVRMLGSGSPISEKQKAYLESLFFEHSDAPL